MAKQKIAPYGSRGAAMGFITLPQVQLRFLDPATHMKFMHICRVLGKKHSPFFPIIPDQGRKKDFNIIRPPKPLLAISNTFSPMRARIPSIWTHTEPYRPISATFLTGCFPTRDGTQKGGGPNLASLGTARRRASNLSQTPDQSRSGKNNAWGNPLTAIYIYIYIYIPIFPPKGICREGFN